jgi:hypothetical protein
MGRYYDEAAMGPVRDGLARRLTGWPGVHAGVMFGCPCFDADGKLFAFVATHGIVLTQLEWADRAELAKLFRAGPFAPEPGRAATKWSLIPASRPEDLEPLVPWIRKSYEAAKGAATAGRPVPAEPRRMPAAEPPRKRAAKRAPAARRAKAPRGSPKRTAKRPTKGRRRR